MYGVVTKYYSDKGYGYIKGDSDEQIYFLHKKDLNDEYIEAGYHVYFKNFKTKKRKYNAAILFVIEAPERERKYAKTHK
ncbi:MAG: cold shock domain-containing protein [Clostridiales bacterium]|nr:cold shock domain-containing protein [Clostridiales bacterium]